jgi:hypothetical protein
MGYTTEFTGRLNLNKKLSLLDKEFLLAFNNTRRMKRNLVGYGVEGEFYVANQENFGQKHTPDIIDYNESPSTQPGLWCKWKPTDDGLGIEWDGREKAYDMPEWVVYLINRYLGPRGYILNGVIEAQGEDHEDVWTLRVSDNMVYTIDQAGNYEAVKWDKAPTLAYKDSLETKAEKESKEDRNFSLSILKAQGELWVSQKSILTHIKVVLKDYPKSMENAKIRVILKEMIENYSKISV